MGAAPVEAAAAGTDAELVLGARHVRRDPGTRLLRRDRLERMVAAQAAPQQAGGVGPQPELFQHLPDLLLHLVRADEEMVAGEPPLDQPAVAGEDGASFGHGERAQVGIVEGGIVGDVEVEHPQPAGKGAEHGIGDQAGWSGSDERGVQNVKTRRPAPVTPWSGEQLVDTDRKPGGTFLRRAKTELAGNYDARTYNGLTYSGEPSGHFPAGVPDQVLG